MSEHTNHIFRGINVNYRNYQEQIDASKDGI